MSVGLVPSGGSGGGGNLSQASLLASGGTWQPGVPRPVDVSLQSASTVTLLRLQRLIASFSEGVEATPKRSGPLAADSDSDSDTGLGSK